jgi:prophage regulatory protein
MTPEILRLPQVKLRTGLSRASIYALIAQGRFPKQIKLSPVPGARAAGWIGGEIDSWLRERIAASRPDKPEAA